MRTVQKTRQITTQTLTKTIRTTTTSTTTTAAAVVVVVVVAAAAINICFWFY